MDVKLESLIEKIKKDGIEEAKKASKKIIQKAHQEAENITHNAEVRAKKIIESTRQEAEKLKNNTEASLKQAARDLVLILKEQMINLFSRVLKGSISKQLKPDFLKELIMRMVDKWAADKGNVFDVLVSEEDKAKVEELVFSHLREEAKEMIEINISKAVHKGFRVGVKGENVYYDFTDESILESLKEFLSPAITAVLDTGNG